VPEDGPVWAKHVAHKREHLKHFNEHFSEFNVD
jgi:hypothetical protein